MKKLILLLMMLFVVTGCRVTEKNSGSDLPSKNEVSFESETFSDDYYVNFPKARNLVKYLNLTSKDVKVLSQVNNKLVFCLTIDEKVNTGDESQLSYMSYIKLLEKEGYETTVFDSTLSQTFLSQNDDYKISLKILSNVEEWKKENQDEPDTQNISTENFIYEITLKSDGD